jgi:hypothetical protein
MKLSGTLVLASWLMLSGSWAQAAQTPETGKADAGAKPATSQAPLQSCHAALEWDQRRAQEIYQQPAGNRDPK